MLEAALSGRRIPPLPSVLRTSNLSPADLRGMYRGAAAFLVCGGPSLNQLDLSKMGARGLLSMGVNNSWSIHRPTLWTCADNPRKFLHARWMDPSITKFVPVGYWRTRLRDRTGEGAFFESSRRVFEAPATFFFTRGCRFNHTTFLDEPLINWGQGDKDIDSVGVRGKRSVMLIAVHLLHLLGVRTIYLLGCDFKMGEGAHYAFEEDRTLSSIRGNNALYDALGVRFKALRPHFEERGLTVLNCSPGSALEAFDHIPFDQAVAAASMPVSGPTKGWYSANVVVSPPLPLSGARDRERQKYEKLAAQRPEYGGWLLGALVLTRIVTLWKAKMVVDFGCSRNRFIRTLRERGVAGMGVDFAFPEADIKAPMHATGLEGGCADVVTSFDALEHLLPEEVDEVLAEMHRVAAKGARFVFSISYQKSHPRWEEELHMTVRPEQWWLDRIGRWGTVTEKVGKCLVGTFVETPTVGPCQHIYSPSKPTGSSRPSKPPRTNIHLASASRTPPPTN